MRLTPRYEGPAVLTLDGPVDDVREPAVRQQRRFADLAASLSDDQLATASRCDGWSVLDVLAHLVDVDGFWVSSIEAGLAGTPTRIMEHFDPTATPPLLVEQHRARPNAEVVERFVSASRALADALGALDADGWSTDAELPPGHLPIRLLAHHALWDAWVHERDVRLPLGLPVVAEDDELAACLRYSAGLGPALVATPDDTRTGAFGIETHDPAVHVVVEVSDVVAVHSGDTPSGAVVVRGDATELVEAFALRTPLEAEIPAEDQWLFAGLAAAFS